MIDGATLGTIIGAGGGTLIGGGLTAWLFKSYLGKVDELIKSVVRLETTVKLNETMKEDVKNHEIRLTIIEPKLARAHERIDEFEQ
jgi:hypothetical protein